MAAACETTFWEVPEGAKRTDRLQLTCSSSCCCRFVVGLLSVDVVAICSVQGCGKNDMFVQVQVNNKAGWECIIWKFACLFDHTDWGELLVQLTPFCAVVTSVSFELQFWLSLTGQEGQVSVQIVHFKAYNIFGAPCAFPEQRAGLFLSTRSKPPWLKTWLRQHLSDQSDFREKSPSSLLQPRVTFLSSSSFFVVCCARAMFHPSTLGIGFAIAKRFLEEGASVVVSSRKENNVKEAVQDVSCLMPTCTHSHKQALTDTRSLSNTHC